MENAIYSLLHHTKVEEVVSSQPKILAIHPDDTIEYAVKIMSENKVSSLPVVDRATGEIAGLIDMLDVVRIHRFVEL